jgi:hypothetical protein
MATALLKELRQRPTAWETAKSLPKRLVDVDPFLGWIGGDNADLARGELTGSRMVIVGPFENFGDA